MTLITLAEAKAYLRVDTADEDGVIIGLLSAAARLCADVARLTNEQWMAIDSDQEDEALTTPWASDLCIGFGSDVYSYNPFPQTGGQPYQALAANYMIVDVPDPNA